MPNERAQVSIIIPAYNVEKNIGVCLNALLAQTTRDEHEIIVVDDGSRDATRAVADACGVHVIVQENRGAAAARNVGAQNARGDILLFIDGDCVPARNWVQAMLAPFADPEIVGACGMKQTKQRGIVPRFIQMEFDYRYDKERKRRYIDFVDSGTAAYRRAIFLENGGFDTRLSDAEDVDLSYRLSERGYQMAFAENAVVYDPHPESLLEYLRRKFEYAFWRARVYAHYPRKLASDSRTPQTQRAQGVLVGSLVLSLFAVIVWRDAFWLTGLIALVFALTTLPFAARYFKHDPTVAILSPLFTALSAFAGSLGLGLGILRAKLKHDA